MVALSGKRRWYIRVGSGVDTIEWPGGDFRAECIESRGADNDKNMARPIGGSRYNQHGGGIDTQRGDELNLFYSLKNDMKKANDTGNKREALVKQFTRELMTWRWQSSPSYA